MQATILAFSDKLTSYCRLLVSQQRWRSTSKNQRYELLEVCVLRQHLVSTVRSTRLVDRRLAPEYQYDDMASGEATSDIANECSHFRGGRRRIQHEGVKATALNQCKCLGKTVRDRRNMKCGRFGEQRGETLRDRLRPIHDQHVPTGPISFHMNRMLHQTFRCMSVCFEIQVSVGPTRRRRFADNM